MDNQETVPAFEPTPLSDVLGRRDDARASEAPAGQQEPASEPVAASETGATPEAKPEQPRAADGKFAPKPKDTGPPPEGNADPDTVPFAAHKDEREKRQKAERLLAERDAQIADLMRRAAPPAPMPQVEQPKQPEEFPWDDPLRPSRELRQEFEGQIARQRFQFSEMMARNAYPDFAEAEAAFKQAIEAQARATGVPVQQTALAAGMRASDHPAEYAYKVGKQAMVLARLGADPEAHIEAEVQRRLAERLAAAPASQPSPTPATALPASLAASRSATAPRAGAWHGPTPLSDILGPRHPRR